MNCALCSPGLGLEFALTLSLHFLFRCRDHCVKLQLGLLVLDVRLFGRNPTLPPILVSTLLFPKNNSLCSPLAEWLRLRQIQRVGKYWVLV